ncbi:hypothetical protein HRF87_00500 [Bacillus sp. CRN 9]|nr:hypothetical protein [Bacillus sp. CRN 9]
MNAPDYLLNVWKRFDGFPMETLTKVWAKKQRSVSQMREDQTHYGITGNCFDLSIWLLNEFKEEGIKAYPIGHHLHSKHAHAAIIAEDERGRRFLCDLGDQWLKPILIDVKDQEYTNEKLGGFFPAADIRVSQVENNLQIEYFRPSGKVSRQIYDASRVEESSFYSAAEYSQQTIHPIPLLECRCPYKNEIAHWEFYGKSFLSTTEGLIDDPDLHSVQEWTARINKKTGFNTVFLNKVLEIYKNKIFD